MHIIAQIKKAYIKLNKLKKFLHKIKFKYHNLLFPIGLTFFVAFFDSLGIGLLAPLTRGVIGMDFTFVKESMAFKAIACFLPKIFIETNRPNSSIFILLLGTIFISVVIKNILSYFSKIILSYQLERFVKDFRVTIFSRYLSFGKLFFDKTNTGNLNTILMSFVEQITETLFYVRDFITNIITLAFFMIILGIISWRATIFMLILFPCLHFSLNWIIEIVKSKSVIQAHLMTEQARRTLDILACILLVKANKTEELEKRHFEKITSNIAKIQFEMNKSLLMTAPIQELVLAIIFLFMVGVMSFIFTRGYVTTISNFLIFFYIVRRCAPLFGSIAQLKIKIAKVEGAMRHLLRIFDDKDKFFIHEGDKECTDVKEKIEFKNLNFSYVNGRNVLKNISFAIKKNEMTAIVGPTGSGKTTIVNLIMRFYDIAPNSLFIDRTDIRDFTLKSLRRQVAIVSQDTLLFNDTVKKNIVYGYRGKPSEEELIDAIKKARLYDFIMGLPNGLDTVIGERGVRLSGGEKQRLSVARMLFKKSKILIMDEATSSLDSMTEQLIQEAIDEAIKDRTSIVIAHRLSTIKHADKIIVIENGELAEQGPLNVLLEKKGKFYKYWEAQKFY